MLNSVEVCRINKKQFYRKESGVSGKKHRALENMPRVVERSLCSRSITSQKLGGGLVIKPPRRSDGGGADEEYMGESYFLHINF